MFHWKPMVLPVGLEPTRHNLLRNSILFSSMITKICSKCKTPKILDEFYFRNKKEGIRSHHCIPCFKVYRDAHYQNNKTSYKERCGKRRDKIGLEVKRKLFDYLTEHSCVDCGETNPLVLDFDHEDPKAKIANVTTLVRRHCSWTIISNEIDKCKIRCSNCHRRRTAKQTNCIYLKWCSQ